MLHDKIKSIIENSSGYLAVVVKNLFTGESFSFNEKEVFPSASTIKLVILSELLRQCKIGQLSLNDKIEIKEEFLTDGDGILKEFEFGHKFSLKEIAILMIIISDNMATNILINLLGIDNINKTGIALGLNNTILQRKMMDFEAKSSGKDNYTCAQDMARILELIYLGQNIDDESSKIMHEILLRQQVGGRLGLYLPDEIAIAHKTGDLDHLEHDVGIVYFPKAPYLVCVLTKDLKTNKDGREVIGLVSRAIYDEMITT